MVYDFLKKCVEWLVRIDQATLPLKRRYDNWLMGLVPPGDSFAVVRY